MISFPEIEHKHTRSYINLVKTKSESLMEDQNIIEREHDVYFSKDTFASAKLAVDGCLTAMEKILDTNYPHNVGFCNVRPPGHHAKHDHYAGFSFFNNVALAAQKAVSQGKRVLIFDWDVHHGDGTQTMFYDND